RLWRRLSLESGRRWVGWTGEALVDELGWGGSLIGRNHAYRPIVFDADAGLGDFVEVRITEAKAGYLLGRAD
ncbi:MAG: TRAM domain-containing protein, partial [Candidatus Bathyarchaeota archaeon]|nr:TRAM domain-containing protein [Candidatus Bathyarchaeota archaeon]